MTENEISSKLIHFAQVLTYLRLGNFKLGLLINFHEALLTTGLKRIVNKL
jgi:GxxExxY protein